VPLARGTTQSIATSSANTSQIAQLQTVATVWTVSLTAVCSITITGSRRVVYGRRSTTRRG
jgi:hypothetical protein